MEIIAKERIFGIDRRPRESVMIRRSIGNYRRLSSIIVDYRRLSWILADSSGRSPALLLSGAASSSVSCDCSSHPIAG